MHVYSILVDFFSFILEIVWGRVIDKFYVLVIQLYVHVKDILFRINLL